MRHDCAYSLNQYSKTSLLIHEPGIDFDEVELHRVCARRQVERLRDVGPFALDTVTSANFPEIAACGSPPAIPTVELLLAIKR